MIKKVSKIAVASALSLSLLGSSSFLAQEGTKVEAATKLPDNHTIEQLEVKWLKDGRHGYSIDVGDRVGTLLIRVDRPKTEWDIEWVNWAISKPAHVSFGLQTDLDIKNHKSIAPLRFGLTYERYLRDKGVPDRFGEAVGALKSGLMKFSDFSDPQYYAGLAIKLDKKYNQNGVYWFGGNAYALREPGQVKAYFFNNQELVSEAYDRIKSDGTFPLMSKVMWGKTELWKGQLGKVTVKEPTSLVKRLDNGSFEKVRDLKKGDEYRVYRYLNERNGMYGVGAGMYVERDAAKVLYETPSKRNLRLVRIMHGEE
ncbi:hypothetical protein FZD47_21120 [Bacillus infantis]|uniref:Uncharacterized protein n=1 Tax=Bacillus infantis TaxID=324767 RepID=A0A5D4SFD7_9BACI|nr:hypothetical protein [Bacillus infantis]TYS60712.1 hypothetical protein FZD47_21120 [Bacillus infantis]